MSSSDDAPVLRPAGPDDTEALCALIGDVFPDNPKADPAVLRWQFWDNPYGRAASWVFEHDGQLVCHFAVLPLAAVLDGRPITAAKPADAATRPEYRGQGLMGRAAQAVFGECAERDIPVTLCLPNFRARGALAKIGMQEVTRAVAYVLPLDADWLGSRFRMPRPVARAARRLAFGAPRPGPAARTAEPPDGLDELWQHNSAHVTAGVVHDARWWRWRYVDRPGGDYRFYEQRASGRLTAAAALTEKDAFGGRFLYLLDLQADDQAAAEAVLAAAIADRGDAVGIVTLTLPANRIGTLVRRAGFRRLPSQLEPHPQVFGLMHNDPDVGDLTDRPWQITWADLDHL